MSETNEKISAELEFQIRSTDPNRSNQQLLEEIRDREAELLEAVRNNLQAINIEKVTVAREKRFGTGLAEAIIIAFLIEAAKGAGKVSGETAAKAILTWVEAEFTDVEIIQLNLSDKTAKSDEPDSSKESDETDKSKSE